jgi:hypothetical protein
MKMNMKTKKRKMKAKMKKEREGKAGPSAPVAGLSAAIKEASGAPPIDLADLLQRHRECKGADKAVAEALLNSLSYLAYAKYEAAVRKGRKDTDDLLGVLFEDLGTCIKRLASNDVPPEQIVAYIKAELHHSKEHLVMENILSLAPPPSTRVSREKKGQEPYPTPRRVRYVEQTRWEPDPQPKINPLEDPFCSHRVEAEDGKVAVPSRFYQPPVEKRVDDEDSYTFLADVLVKAAETPLEKTVAGMLLTGHSGNAIARSLKVPRNQITNVIGVLRARVGSRMGTEVDVTQAEPLAGWPAPEVVLDLPVPRSSLSPARAETARQAVEQMAV